MTCHSEVSKIDGALAKESARVAATVFQEESFISGLLLENLYQLGPFSAHLGGARASWALLSGSRGVLGPSWRRLGRVWGRLGAVLGRLGDVLEASLAVLAASVASRAVGVLWGCFRVLWGCYGVALRVLGQFFLNCWTIFDGFWD